ncbi:MAG: Bor family protein [Bacteroidetes bacterium]|nr:Bor family protein [Bacteroidota bacterium]
MKKIRCFTMAALMAFLLSSCYTSIHTVGNGSKTGVKVQDKEWYALFGLVPINKVDSKLMAGGATDYTIKTQHKFVDVVISAFTGIVTISCQTVEVQK